MHAASWDKCQSWVSMIHVAKETFLVIPRVILNRKVQHLEVAMMEWCMQENSVCYQECKQHCVYAIEVHLAA